jgi:polar amino acid transport system ATP-binding protein
MTTPMVHAQGIYKSYAGRDVLRGVDFSVNRGEVACLIGPSGSGKSTLLRCINHLEQHDAGLLYVDGQLVGYEERNNKLYERTARELCEARSHIGMVFQRFNLFSHLTALENITIGQRVVRGRSQVEATNAAEQLLDRVGLAGRGSMYPSQLSGGQQQRVAIARALAMEPSLMLFDEPTSALDPELVGEVLDVMRELADSGMTMIVVTHEIAFAREVGDVVYFLDEGVIEESGQPSQVLTTPQSPRLASFLAKVL